MIERVLYSLPRRRLLAGLTLALFFTPGCGGGGSFVPWTSNRLASLETSLAWGLSPAFHPDTTHYTIGPGSLPDSVVLIPRAQDRSATIMIDGVPITSGAASPPLPLAMGVTSFGVTVTELGGEARTYVLEVDRTSAGLAGLSTSAGPLTPTFRPGVDAYGVGPTLFDGQATLTATLEDPDATLEVNGIPTASGLPSSPFELPPGITPVTVVARARDGVTTSTTTVMFHRGLGGTAAYLKASNLEAIDLFGWAVAADGDTLVATARAEDGNGSSPADNSENSSGAAYVFVRDGSSWVQQAYLKAANAAESDSFGWACAIDGDTIAITAPSEGDGGEGIVPDSVPYSGAVYVFVRDNGIWTQQAYLKAQVQGFDDFFGRSVGISGDTIVVGARAEDGNGTDPLDDSADEAGAAYVFVRSGTTWTQQAYLKASNVDAGDGFGQSVAISGDTIVVGANNEGSDGSDPADNSLHWPGAAYVFVRSGTVWTEQAYLKAPNAGPDDGFGWTVAVDGDTVAVGASAESSDGSSPDNDDAQYSGAVYVFTRSGTTWTQQAYLKASNALSFSGLGSSLDLEGDTLVAGAPGWNGGLGSVYVFARTGSSWLEVAQLEAPSPTPGDSLAQVGAAVSNGAVVGGCWGEDGNGSGPANNDLDRSGAVFVWR